MNTHSRSLGVFVPGTATAQLYLQNPFSAQQGMGDFVPASFPVPQNPIADGNGGLGQFMDACFPVPQNPIADAANIIPASAAHGTGMGCASCGGSCGSGMGDVATFVSNISAGDWQGVLTGDDLWSGIPNIVVVLGGTWLITSIIGDLFRTGRAIKKAPEHITKRAAAAKKAKAAYAAALAE